MAKSKLTDNDVEQEIKRLLSSPYVKLCDKEENLRNKRRRYLYSLRNKEKRGKKLADAGYTLENIDKMIAETNRKIKEAESEEE